MKNIVLLTMCMFALWGCSSMEDKHSQYLEDVKLYAPKVAYFEAIPDLREATLYWYNESHLIVKNALIYDNTVGSNIDIDTIFITPDSVADFTFAEYKLTNLQIKGYEVFLYAIDAKGNWSIPESVNFFPNGEDN